MDKERQSEVTNNLRSAIKKKVAEISDMEHNDLSEYIMILVANERSKSHVENDLALFLGEETSKFTDWLFDLLDSLNVGSKNIHPSQRKSDSNAAAKQKDIEADEDAIILDCDPDEQEKDLFSHEDTNDSNLSKMSNHYPTPDFLELMKETSLLKSQTTKVFNKNKNVNEQGLPKVKPPKIYMDRNAKGPLSSKVVSVRKRFIDSGDEYDPAKPEYKDRPKHMISRNYAGPAALQANKLLLKAVDDATKSILDGKNIEDYYKPTPIKDLSSKRFRNDISQREGAYFNVFSPTKDILQNSYPVMGDSGYNAFSPKKDILKSFPLKKNIHNIYSPPKNVQNLIPPERHVHNPFPSKNDVHTLFVSKKDFGHNVLPSAENAIQVAYLPKEDTAAKSNKKTLCQIVPEPDFNSDISQTSVYSDQHFSNIFMAENYMDSPGSSQNNRTICLRTIPLISENPELERCTSRNSPEYLPATEEIRPKSPHFIVTLEGVKLSSFKRKLDNSVDSMDEDEDDNMLEEVLNDEPSPSKKLKINERCKYWPACKNSDHCSYHHPTVPCKCFPDCKYGDKCLYIHPNCKFDALCSRKDCPFTHASKRKLSLATVPLRMVPVKRPKLRSVCKYFPKCTAKSCPFLHPKLCRFGTACRLPVCLYSHFPLPSRSQMKWQAIA